MSAVQTQRQAKTGTMAGALVLTLGCFAGQLAWAQDAGNAQEAGHGEMSLAARIQVLEDKEAIRDLLLEYGRTLDARDLKGYANLFSRDGVWVGGFGESGKGPAGVLALMEKNVGYGPNSNRTYHLLSNFVIDVHGDAATAWSRWAFVTKDGESPKLLHSGRYEDSLVRENGKWKFQKRVTFNDIPYLDPAESN